MFLLLRNRYYKNMDRLNLQQKLWAEVLYCSNFKSFNESVKYLKELISLDDQQPITYFQLGDAYLFSGQFDKAISEFSKAMEIFRKWHTRPFWVSFYCELGIAYHKAGLYGKEKKLYKKAEKDFPGDPGIMDQQAWLFLTLGDTATANRYIRKWISIRKDESWTEARIAGYLAFIYSMAGMSEKEVEYCRLALSCEPENIGRMSTLAFVLVARDWNVKEGMELAEKVLKSKPDNFGNRSDYCNFWQKICEF